MPYIISAIDHQGMEDLRENLRQKHRAHLKLAGKKLLGSGALLDDEGVKIIGGMSIFDTEIQSEAQKFADEDPYSKAGIRKVTTVVKWRRRWLDGEFLGSNNL